MPWVTELLNQLGAARFLETQDLSKGYWQFSAAAFSTQFIPIYHASLWVFLVPRPLSNP